MLDSGINVPQVLIDSCLLSVAAVAIYPSRCRQRHLAWQRELSPLTFCLQRPGCLSRIEIAGRHKKHDVYEIAVPCRRVLVVAIALVHGTNFVGDLIGERVDDDLRQLC